MRRGKKQVVLVTVAVLAVHAALIGAYLGSGHGVRDYIDIGPRFIDASRTSSVIGSRALRRSPPGDGRAANAGYDGQFYYFIALDPSKARHYVDYPAYRYERILYPMLARFTALAQPAAVPWTMLIISWLAVGGGVLALGAWLSRRGVSPWLAAIYGLYPGMLIALQHDLTDPLAYGLVALAIYLFDFGGRRGVLLSAVAFGLAALSRETTILFTVLFGLSILAGRANANPHPELRARVRQAAGFFSLALVPFATWLALDYGWFGIPHPGTVDSVPFDGALGPLIYPGFQLACVAIPAVLFSAALLRYASAKAGRLEMLCMLANTALAVVFSSNSVWINYMGLGRAAIAVVLAALLCIPYLPERSASPRRAGAALVSARVALTLWMLPLTAAVLAACSGRLFNP